MLDEFLLNFWEYPSGGLTPMPSAQPPVSLGAKPSAIEARQNIHQLTERLDKLTLVCMAMWELIQKQTNLTEDELQEKIKEIDLRDGRADGKVSKSVLRCTGCDRVMSSRHTRCMYCGNERLDASAFEGV